VLFLHQTTLGEYRAKATIRRMARPSGICTFASAHNPILADAQAHRDNLINISLLDADSLWRCIPYLTARFSLIRKMVGREALELQQR